MTLGPVLPWLIPPVLGAAAGGILGRFAFPRIASQALRRRRAPLGQAAAQRAKEVTSWMLSLPVSRLLPPAGSAAEQRLEQVVADAAAGILGSREMIYAVRDLASNAVGGLASRPVAEIARELGVRRVVSDTLLPAVAEERRRRAFSDEAGDLIARKAGVAISDEVVQEISRVVETAMPAASEALVRWLDSAETRQELSLRGRELLPRILEKLSDLQKLFVTAGQFDRRLNEKMPEIVDETVRALESMARDPRQQERLVTVVSEALRGWRDSLLVMNPEAEPSRDSAPQKLARASSSLLERLLGTLEDPGQRGRIADAAAGALEKDRRTLAAFARDVFHLREEDVTELICARLLAFLTRPETARELARRVVGLLPRGSGEAGAPTLRDALRMDAGREAQLEQSVRAALPSLVEQAAPPVERFLAGSAGAGRLLGLLGAGAGLCAGLVVIAMKILGLG